MALPPKKPRSVMHLAPGHWAGHMRIYHRECLTLAKAGYNVELVAHTLPGETFNGKVRLRSLGDYTGGSLAWRLPERVRRNRESFALALQSDATLYHFHAPEFIPWARKLRRVSKRPVLFDCMEDFEGYIRQRRGISNRLRRPLALMTRWLLRIAARNCDAVIVADRGTATMLEPYAKRVLVLHNFPQLALFPPGASSGNDQVYDLVYHGSIPRYHLEACLGIDKALVERGHRVKWRLIGQIPERGWFEEELGRQGIANRFFLSGLIPHDKVAAEVRKARIGIMPLPNLPKFQNNIPQKLFEFMALGLPVVLSDLPPSRPFVGDGGCGFMVPPENYQAYAEAIIRLLKDPAMRVRMGAEGRKRVEQKYNWEKESQKLLQLYSDLLGYDQKAYCNG